jgi:hypothetical protein
MKIKHSIFVILLVNTYLCGFGQKHPAMSDETKEKFYAQKVAFITDKLALTPSEAQVFWPIYNEYQAKKNLINDERRKNNMYLKENQDNLSDKELEPLCDKFVSFDKQESDLQIEYNKKFKATLPIKKVVKLYQAEFQFKGYLLRQIRNSDKPGNRKGMDRND